MSSYTITITPDDNTHASTTVRFDVSGSTARITELLVRSGSSSGLAANQLPAVDLDLLLRAVMPGGASGTRNPATTVTVPESTPRRRTAARRPRATKATGKAETPAKATKSTRTGKKAVAGGERAYRRAPDDLVDVFNEIGGVTAVARHYGVPRHTAQSWIRRLRNEGRLPAGR